MTFDILKTDLTNKFGAGEFAFITTPVGDDVIECKKEAVPALLRYLKEYAN